jgi:hypothetical protein
MSKIFSVQATPSTDAGFRRLAETSIAPISVAGYKSHIPESQNLEFSIAKGHHIGGKQVEGGATLDPSGVDINHSILPNHAGLGGPIAAADVPTFGRKGGRG